jgi:MAF protein
MNMSNQNMPDSKAIQFNTPTIVLASNSPRRERILRAAGIQFVKLQSGIDDSTFNFEFNHDDVSAKQVKQYVKQMALTKLKPFTGRVKNTAVITADTVVWCDNKILEKPMTVEKCTEQHEFISGKTNYVYTAVAVYNSNTDKTLCKVLISKVKIAKLSSQVIKQICAEPETLDASGYRSTGAIRPYIKIKNSEHALNVEGISPKLVKKLLKQLGFTT